MERAGEFFRKIKKEQLILCFLFGVLLLVVALPTGIQNKKEEQESLSGNAHLLERQLEEALTGIEGIGAVQASIMLEPLVDGHAAPEIRGILVVAETGDNPVAVQKIQESVMTLFQVEAHKIKVMKMK